MTPTDISLVRADFSAIGADADGFAARFYDRLFELDPTLRPFFSADLAPQRRKLVQALAVVVAGLDRLDEIVATVTALGRRHGDYGVTADHYAIVGEALLATLEERVVGFDEIHRAAWGRAYTLLADVMIVAGRNAVAA